MEQLTTNITLDTPIKRGELFPSLHAKVSGWKPQIDGTGWSVGRVVHSLNDDGFTTALELMVSVSTR
ncbi:hypothetical protein R77592_03520 [Ralstonia mannitolilytica]|uniref:hypothetical protein n=1 Tax=Ralstonia mannitolilytica TaxID=105219 RepID=UPI0028F69CDC|nr:hypothetical protein [Ralstonia mannitolilytica]CAJ0734465.1 hypothetical protein R77592_03520 [Ralstonia mannitolilytica]